MRYFYLLFIVFLVGHSASLKAQVRTGQDADAELDSLRKLDEEGRDTVIFTAKFIRYTTIGLLKDSTQTIPLDTALTNLHNYNPLNQPHRPTINLGNMGLAAREMLFNPRKSIGFDPGFHSMDIYKLTPDSVKYYRARTPFTSMYYVTGTETEQVFKVTHSQNIKPNWNIGADYFKINARGFYTNQTTNHLNGAVFTWYEGPKKRYNLLANVIYNTLKAAENGSVLNDTIFNANYNNNIPPNVRLSGSDPVKQTWKHKTFYLKQFYYIGRIDTVKNLTAASSILPTQRFSHALTYSTDSYKFYKNQDDINGAFPNIPTDSVFVKDSTNVRNLRNEFMYSFYLRGRSVSFIKNELKLDVGLQHDLYWYQQLGPQSKFQNTTFKANVGYRFSDKVSVSGQLNQIAQGTNAGDYLYDAQTQILLGRSAGRIVLGAYIQNKSPERIFEQVNYTYHKWNHSFDNTKINNLSFSYLNPKFSFRAKAEYFLINNYLYFGDAGNKLITPVQEDDVINMVKVTVAKDFRFKRFVFENFAVFQKTDFENTLRTPELYIHNSFYYSRRISKAVAGQAGFDSRWNSSFAAPSYAINVGQFYNGFPVKYSSYPIIDVWGKFALNRANLFVRYDYANKGLFSKGYYTVSRYPMPGSLFKFGVIWNFYD